jgi:hypothetical protein
VAGQTPSPNGSSALAKLLNQLNLPTLALILLTGGGNWFATEKTSTDRGQQLDQAVRQIHDLHEALDETDKRQRTALNNQTQLLEHDSRLLTEVHEIAVKIERMRQLDQMRGVPP